MHVSVSLEVFQLFLFLPVFGCVLADVHLCQMKEYFVLVGNTFSDLHSCVVHNLGNVLPFSLMCVCIIVIIIYVYV